MPYDSKGKNRYSFDESRNLSRGREYRSFQPHSSPSHQMHPLVEIEVEIEAEAEGASLRHVQWLTSVAFGATAGPQKEGALVCSKGANLGPARGSSAGPSPLRKGDYSIAALPPLDS